MRFAFPRTTKVLGIAAIALAAAFTAGCGDGGTPSGAKGAAPASSGGSTGGGSAGGSTGGSAGGNFRAVAFNLDDVIPTGGGANEVWLFFQDPGNLAASSIDVEVNGNKIGNANLNLFQVGSGSGQMAAIPLPAAGSTIKVVANTQGGSPVASNTIVVKAPGYAAGNTPAGNFKTRSPKDGDQNVSTGPDLVFDAAAQAASHLAIVMELGFDPATQQTVITDFPVVVDLAQASGTNLTVKVGVSNPGVAFANLFLPNGGAFTWNVVALDSTGWGVGTTIDVAGFNNSSSTPPQSVLDTWPFFTTQ